MELNVLYEDRNLLVAVKPAGVDSESSGGLRTDMVNLVRNRLRRAETGHSGAGRPETSGFAGGMPYVGLIQRLDKPVRGLMVFAKDKKTAAALSKQLREGKIRKTYRAILCGRPEEKEALLTDWIAQEKKGNLSRVVKPEEAASGNGEEKEARLRYRVLKEAIRDGQMLTEVEIHLLTGRHHQIRVQFASRGLPLLGDRKYHPDPGTFTPSLPLCLAAVSLEFRHPGTGKVMNFSAEAPFSL